MTQGSLRNIALVAVTIRYESKRVTRSVLKTNSRRIERAILEEQARIGFDLFQWRRKHAPPAPSAAGVAWATAAIKIYDLSRELERVAGGLKDGKWEVSFDADYIFLDHFLVWRTDPLHRIERWLGIKLTTKHGFLSELGYVVESQLDLLCENIKRLYELENQLRRLHGSANGSQTTP